MFFLEPRLEHMVDELSAERVLDPDDEIVDHVSIRRAFVELSEPAKERDEIGHGLLRVRSRCEILIEIIFDVH